MKNRRVILLGLALIGAAACGRGQERQGAPAAEAPNLSLPPQELLGIDSSEVVLAVPWNDQGLVSHDPTPGQVRATLASVTLSGGPGFERVAFEFLPYSGLPAYRIAWDSTAVACRLKPDPKGASRYLVVSMWPTQAREVRAQAAGEQAASTRQAAPGGQMRAKQACNEAEIMSWQLTVPKKGAIRVSELRNPPRLLVDVHEPEATPAAAPALPGATDSARAQSAK